MMRRSHLILAGLGALSLAACGDRDSPAENVADKVETQADTVRASGDNMADGIEEQAAALEGNAGDAAQNKAANIRDDAENKADAMEDQADKVRNGETR